MKIVVFNGSPHMGKGNTHVMVEAFLQGAREAGAEVENVFLFRKKIKPCLGCFDCWLKTPGKCVQKDDMEGLLPLFIKADLIVFATPLYVDNVTGIMKTFMDRMIPLTEPYFEKDPQGEYRHRKRYEKIPKIAVISNCGFAEQTHFQVLSLLFKRIARNMHSELIAEIYRGGGEVLKMDIPVLLPLVEKYKEILKKAGREIATDGKLSENTQAELEKPIVPYDKYMEGANKYWEKLLSAV
ncbi:MAG: flavodoxin family protein [Syntrophales bacterium]|jgi:multimeric flavodoxin WrbA|nr:flavodoxin family protein [Syntrophales bacterium]